MMDISESTRILFDKIQKLDPENVTKIIGYLLLRDPGDEEIVRLAMAPDHLLGEVVNNVKSELQRLPTKLAMSPLSHSLNPPHVLTHLPAVSPRTSLSPGSFQFSSPHRDPQFASNTSSDFIPPVNLDSIPELQNQTHLYSLDNEIEPARTGMSGFPKEYYYRDNAIGNLSVRGHRRFSSLPEFPVKICPFFSNGFCKRGSNCQCYHEHVIPASLSQIYDEGQVLQADGYLTESQRRVNVGCSLTNLLSPLKNEFRLIDRPHGHQAIALAEDSPKYMQYRKNIKHNAGQVVSASRQIYLTFPAESTFTEEDVDDYFNSFGPVEDVRIPCQQKRMFGFVTFTDADTVKAILQKGNPHFVHGSRVLVKPYKEKSKLVDRKYKERFEHPVCYYSPQYVDMESELISMPRDYETSRYLSRQLLEEQEQEQILEIERRRFAALQLARRPLPIPHIDYLNGLQVSDRLNIQSAECFSYNLEEKPRQAGTSNTDQDSEGLNLPDNPFASPIATGVSTVI